MKIKKEFLQIRTDSRDDDGKQIDPEEKPAQRVITTDVPMTGRDGRVLGYVQGAVTVGGTVGEFAEAKRNRCFACKNFDQRAWMEYWSKLEALPREHPEKVVLNNLRMAIDENGSDAVRAMHASKDDPDEVDVEQALTTFGICRPLTEIHRDPTIVHPLSACPPEVCSPMKPNGLFVAKDVTSDRLGNSEFDKIMRVAQGGV